MDKQLQQRLIDINRRFYAEFGPAFAATRRRIQEGVRLVLEELPDAAGERWLDLGCGSGALAAEWLRRARQSGYLGLDFSTTLLAKARQAVQDLPGVERTAFAQADLAEPGWANNLGGDFRGALAFAVLHHLPSHGLRLRVLRQVHDLLAPGGLLVHSVWQFQHSPRLLARVQPWSTVGIDEQQLEPGDTLLDWRYALPGQVERVGLRYVHRFGGAELDELARESGFLLASQFESDGQGGRLGLYQVWHRQK